MVSGRLRLQQVRFQGTAALQSCAPAFRNVRDFLLYQTTGLMTFIRDAERVRVIDTINFPIAKP